MQRTSKQSEASILHRELEILRAQMSVLEARLGNISDNKNSPIDERIKDDHGSRRAHSSISPSSVTRIRQSGIHRRTSVPAVVISEPHRLQYVSLSMLNTINL